MREKLRGSNETAYLESVSVLLKEYLVVFSRIDLSLGRARGWGRWGGGWRGRRGRGESVTFLFDNNYETSPFH